MKRSEVNRDPERAVKRAKNDARCAFRKLALLDELAAWMEERKANGPSPKNRAEGAALLETIGDALELGQ